MTYIVQVEPTTRCNLNCNYCTMKEAPADLHPETLDKILDKHPLCDLVRLQGLGEPMLAMHLTDLLLVCKLHGVKCETVTNGTILPDPVPRFDFVWFSLDTLDQDVMDKIRPNVKVSRVIGNIHRVRLNGIPIGINFVKTPWNTQYDYECVKDFCRIYKIRLAVAPMENWHNIPSADVKAARKIWGPEMPRKLTCPWGSTRFYYDVYGIEHPCCIRMNSQYRLIGNVDRRQWCGKCPD